MQILINAEACVGCRICEIACSFHHNHTFSPELSSIKISRDNQNGEIGLSVDPTCDLCDGEDQLLCVKYCIYGVISEEK
ncbi:hypothetical protein ACFLYI_01275 [Chloroflexota bacterium]